MYRPSSAVQPSNAPVSILSSFSGRLTLTSPSQYAKASYPILVRFFEKYIDFRELQPLNEVSPIVVTLSGMVIASRLPQYPKAPLISSRPAGNDCFQIPTELECSVFQFCNIFRKGNTFQFSTPLKCICPNICHRIRQYNICKIR